jgi:hypothetical protein
MNTARRPMYAGHDIPWRKVERAVFKLQQRIYRASGRDDVKTVHKLQRLLCKSWYAKLLATRRVTQDNRGHRTAGVDGVKSLTPPQRLRLAPTLHLSPKVHPVRRIWRPKPGTTEHRPLGIPVMADRAGQALVKLALEPEWEAKFEPNSYGFRPGRSCHDAIEALRASITQQDKYVLDADIEKCFDRLCHTALVNKLHTFPTLKRTIVAWLKAGVMDGGTLFPTEEGAPQGAVVSPPTKLQTFFFGIVITWIWVDPKHDMDLVTRDFHPLDQRPDEVAFARPVSRLQPVVQFGGKVFEPANNELQFPLQSGLIGQRLALLLQASEALAQAGHPGLKLALVDEALGITVDQPGDALAQLADLAFHGAQGRTFGAHLRLQTAPIFLGEPFGVRQQLSLSRFMV